jgi:undecaprenyl diphosphate synthase
MQSNCPRTGFHVGIIMDGNGRWGSRRGRPRTDGHLRGAETIRRVVAAAPGCGITTLTLYAFSSANWVRPPAEVATLMHLLHLFLRDETAALHEAGIRLSIVGRRDRLPDGLAEAIAAAERATEAGRVLHLRIAVDYSSRQSLAETLSHIAATDAAQIRARLDATLDTVDLIIRTGGEKRLSDFMLWESAFAELWFTPVMWPDFSSANLAAAVADFHRRDRSFGQICAEDRGARRSAATNRWLD